MTQHLTGSLSVVCEYIFNMLEINKGRLGLEAVYYGDQNKIPVTPAACVEPDEKPREYKGAQRMTRVSLHLYVLVYHSKVQSPQQNRRDADIMAESIETLIHADATLGGLVIDGMCTAVSSGYANRGGTMMRASRIAYEAHSQE